MSSHPAAGAAVTAYIIDTGIRTTHSDFGGRASWGTNTTGDGNNTDCNGHGTHIAGTVGGCTYGVAKAVRLVAVKALGCSGSGSLLSVAPAVDWVTADHTSRPAVANMSLGTQGSNSALETAIRNSIADGVTYAARPATPTPTWALQVRDAAPPNGGYIDSWTLDPQAAAISHPQDRLPPPP